MRGASPGGGVRMPSWPSRPDHASTAAPSSSVKRASPQTEMSQLCEPSSSISSRTSFAPVRSAFSAKAGVADTISGDSATTLPSATTRKRTLASSCIFQSAACSATQASTPTTASKDLAPPLGNS